MRWVQQRLWWSKAKEPGSPQHTVSKKSGKVAARKRSKRTTVFVKAKCSEGREEAKRALGKKYISSSFHHFMGFLPHQKKKKRLASTSSQNHVQAFRVEMQSKTATIWCKGKSSSLSHLPIPLHGVTYWQSSCSAQGFSTLAQLIPSMAIICSWLVLTHENGHQILHEKNETYPWTTIIAVVKQVHIFIQKALLHNTELVVLQSDIQNLSWQRRVGPFLAEWAFECYGT